MSLMNVRFVITGSCHVSYSGRQIQLVIPVNQPGGSATTVADVEEQVRRDWPKELNEMADTIPTIGMRILKTGRVLAASDAFAAQLTTTERAECEASSVAGKTKEEIEKSSILMHVVFQKERLPPEPKPAAVTASPKETKPSNQPATASGGAVASSSGEAADSSGREVTSDSCCCAM